MTTSTLPVPDIARPDATFVAARDFTVGSPERQRPAADALIDAWDHIAWPEGLISISVGLGTDGVSISHYVQWTERAAYEAFISSGAATPISYVAAKAPDLAMHNFAEYRLYRSVRDDTTATTGCIVLVNVEFDGPDEQRQRDWVDAVIEALEHDTSEGDLPSGGIAGHFHVSLDGTRVLNVAEWVDEASHIAALEDGGGQSIGDGSLWRRVQTWPGIKETAETAVKRYTPYRLRAAPQT